MDLRRQRMEDPDAALQQMYRKVMPGRAFDLLQVIATNAVLVWTEPTTVDKFCPYVEACSKAIGLIHKLSIV